MTAGRLGEVPAPLLVVGAAFSVQFGAALATTAFDTAGPLGFVWIRVGLAALILVALNARALRRAEVLPLRWVVAAGASVAFMNACFYQAIDRTPSASRRPSSSWARWPWPSSDRAALSTSSGSRSRGPAWRCSGRPASTWIPSASRSRSEPRWAGRRTSSSPSGCWRTGRWEAASR